MLWLIIVGGKLKIDFRYN
ncbi:hypothetical protein [Lactobacillus sp. W8172]